MEGTKFALQRFDKKVPTLVAFLNTKILFIHPISYRSVTVLFPNTFLPYLLLHRFAHTEFAKHWFILLSANSGVCKFFVGQGHRPSDQHPAKP